MPAVAKWTKIQTHAKQAIPIAKRGELKPQDAEQLRIDVLANLKILQQTKASFLQLSALEKTEISITKKSPPSPKTQKEKSPAQATKPKKSPKSKKKDLIDKFIANKPSITPGKSVKENIADLSKASSELKEDLVSENLAVIFAKQGKTNKAIDIYKKLIWKFPQKKASFAARIEELKKK